MDYDLIGVKTLERVYKNYYYIIRGRKGYRKIYSKDRKSYKKYYALRDKIF